MKQRIALITLIVPAYDEAIAFYTQRLGFDLVEDVALDADRRWVVVAPCGSSGSGLLLTRADDAAERLAIGAQAGGRVLLILHTDNFERDYRAYRERGVNFLEEPRTEPYGVVAVFADIFGNRWDLIEPAIMTSAS